MNLKKVFFTAALLLILLTGCAAPRPTTLLSQVEEEPSAAKIEEVKEWARSQLKDPDSMKQFEIEKIVKKRVQSDDGQHDIWGVVYSYNAKNSYGGYAGVSSHCVGITAAGALIELGPGPCYNIMISE